LHIYLLAAA
jgi:hypothetical protein